MAMKDHYCLKGDNQHFVSSNQNGHQYSNLNLNENQKCSSILETFQSKKSISTSSDFNSTQKKNDYATVSKVLDQINFGKNKNQNKCSSWNKTDGGKITSNYSSKTEETSKKWKSNKKNSSSNNSTLSIHTTAYENSIEAQNEMNSSPSGAEKKDGTSKIKINKVLKVLKTGFASMDAFEIPRQQTTETGTNEAEIMGFKASQKLLNPNQPPASSLDITTFSILGHQKLKILVKVFIDKIQVNVVKADFENDGTFFMKLIPFIFGKMEISYAKFDVQSFYVFDRKSNEFIDIPKDYLLQPFDKFELYLVKTEKIKETEIFITESGKEEQQKLSIGNTKIESIGDLSKFLSSKLDIKDGEIQIQKFDEDFGESITVNGEEKFDPSKVYNSQITKIMRFSGVVRPRLTVASNNPNKSNSETTIFEAGLNAAVPFAPSNIQTTLIPVGIAPKSPMAFTTKDNIKAAESQSEKSELKENLESDDIYDINEFSIKKKLRWDYNFYRSMNKPVIFFQSLFGFYSVLNLSEEKLLILSKIVLQYYLHPWLQSAFAPALKNHCRFSLHSLYDHTFHYFFSHLMTAPNSIPIKEFVEGFEGFSLNKYYMFARTLAEIGWILKSRNEPDIVGRLRWFIDEFSRADPSYKIEIFQQILANQSIDYYENCKNLKELIDTVH